MSEHGTSGGGDTMVRDVRAPTVTRCREIWPGMHGDDVLGVKRALSRAGYLPWGTFGPVWDPPVVAAVKAFQAEHAVPPGVGTYGPLTHAALVATHRKGSDTEWAYDTRAIGLMARFCGRLAAAPPLAGARGAVLAEADRLYGRRGEIDYVESRPAALHQAPGVPAALDCSSFVIQCYFAAGAPDPSGSSFTGYGNTTNLLAHGTRCTPQELVAGDLVFFGHTTPEDATKWCPVGSPTHVVLYDHDGMTYSQGGPNRTDRMARPNVDYRPIVACRHHDLEG